MSVEMENERATAWSAITSGLGWAVLLMLVLGAVAFIVGEGELLSDGEAWLLFAAAWLVASCVSYARGGGRGNKPPATPARELDRVE